MKRITPAIAILAIASSAVFAGLGHAEPAACGGGKGDWPIDPPAYVTRNCAYCHGGALVPGYAVTPRLGGQQAEYIVNQLVRLRTHERDNPFALKYMSHAAVTVQPENECELAAYLSAIPPEPANDGNEALIPQGEAIFKIGVPDENIPACQFCHGPEAQGLGKFPRLGGQSYYYLKRRLQQWGEGYATVAEHMPGIASKLAPDQIEAVASYLSFVK
jgi:cytochrome c553